MQTSPNDRVRIALIGAGGMGFGDARSSLAQPGVELAAVCDLYDGRLERARETWGRQIPVTRDYREVLARRDVDAVIVATSDHWHAKIAIDAMEAGKDVYCEKPMTRTIAEGHAVIAAQKKTGRILQVGSQYASSLAFRKARELVAQGAIGQVNLVDCWLDRNSATGAWQYSIPPDASAQTVDWDKFLGSAPKRPFDATRFFRWRNYQDYGTGVAGDLFVHLLTGLHVATGAQGPTRVFAAGGLRFWKDGRDVPDIMLAMLDYPDFTVSLKVNFASGSTSDAFGVRFVGSEGVMVASMTDLRVSRRPREIEPGYTIDTFAKATREKFLEEYRRLHPTPVPTADSLRPTREERFAQPPGFDSHREHHRVFLEAVRTRKPPFEDAVFGLRAAGPALLANTSYFERRVCPWNSESMTS